MFVTGPWENQAKADLNILDINERVHRALGRIREWADNPDSLFTQCKTDCFGKEVQMDPFLEAAQDPDGPCTNTRNLMKELLATIAEVVEKQLTDHLPGGRFWNPSSELREEVKSCVATNVSGERQFGRMKSFQTRAPSMTMTKIEGKQMFGANKVMQAMLEKSEEERKKEMLWATSQGAKVRKKDKEERLKYAEAMKKKLEESRVKLTEKEEKGRENLERILEQADANGGLWSSEAEMNKHTEKLSESAKRDAIKTQVKVRVVIFECKPAEKILISKVDSTKLKTYFIDLLQIEIPDHKKPLEKIMKSPEILIGKSVSQKFEDQLTGIETLYTGKITTMVQNTQTVKRGRTRIQREFEIVFDNESDKPCYQTLQEILVDMASGDMQIEL